MSLPEASTIAPEIDRIFLILMLIGGGVMAVVGLLMLSFAIRYRRGTKARRGPLPDLLSREVEIGWTVATLFVFLFVCWWMVAAELPQFQVPKNAMTIHVVAKQWMWKAEHPSGVREIDALHVPIGMPVALVMTSQDVIHSFYVPAFRIKQDVLPGRYTTTWFQATKAGDYRLLCAEYCGTDHARMTGTIYAMTPEDYARWTAAQPQGDDLAAQGATLYRTLGCAGCHEPGSRVPAPSLAGIAGQPQPLAGGDFATADEAYLRDSIMLPNKQVVAGYAAVMPSYEGIASEDQVIALVAYLKAGDAGRSLAR
jgi:cytochrome c oxidase subunit 2